MRHIVPLLLLLRCKSPSSTAPPVVESRANADTEFWKWVVAHGDELATVKRGDDPIANQLAVELRKIDPGITFELSVGKAPHELIVSADGIRERFPVVQRLTAAAPAIPGWKVIAFRPRKTGTEVKVDDTRTVKMSELRFRALDQSHGKLSVAIYVPGTRDKATMSGVFLLLDGLLGEYDVETQLAGIDFLDGKDAPADARPFAELRTLVDAAKKR